MTFDSHSHIGNRLALSHRIDCVGRSRDKLHKWLKRPGAPPKVKLLSCQPPNVTSRQLFSVAKAPKNVRIQGSKSCALGYSGCRLLLLNRSLLDARELTGLGRKCQLLSGCDRRKAELGEHRTLVEWMEFISLRGMVTYYKLLINWKYYAEAH